MSGDTKNDDQLDKLLDSTLQNFDKKRHKKREDKQKNEANMQEFDMLALFGKAGFPGEFTDLEHFYSSLFILKGFLRSKRGLT